MITKLKNRFGKSDVNKGVVFHGEIGMFRELPKPEEITDYSEYLILTGADKSTTIDNDDRNVFKL